MKTIKFYWKDLTEEKKKEIMEIVGDDRNWDVFPIATLNIEEEYHVPKRKYDVYINITAKKQVRASSFDEAENEANFYVQELDFGELHDIDWEIDAVADECGNFKI